MLEINGSLFVQIANFLILLFLLNLLLYRPIRKILNQRNEKENSLRKLIEDFQGRFAKDEKTLQENMIEARRHGAKEKESLMGAGMEEEKKILQEATSEAEGKIVQAKGEIRDSEADASKSLEDEINLFSQELAEKILGRSI